MDARRDVLRLQVLSDLHLDHPRPSSAPEHAGIADTPFSYDFPVRAEILALLGDIGVTSDDRLFAYLRIQLTRYKLVFFLPGNHEPYGTTVVSKSQAYAESYKCHIAARTNRTVNWPHSPRNVGN